MARQCGIDYGRRRIGLAFSDERGCLVARAITIEVHGSLAARAEAVVVALGAVSPQHLIIGLPQKLDGSPGTLADEVRAFGTLLAERMTLPVAYWDERLTSVEADRLLRDEVGLRRKNRKGPTNSVSASLILQSYLDATSHSKSERMDVAT